MEFSHPDYTIIKTIGQGASGSVYLAVQNRLNRKVAVKVVNDSFTDSGGQRFLREAHILAQLDHPYIVSVYELAELTDRPGYLLAMAYVDGGTLRERARKFTLGEAIVTVRHIAQALGYAHQHGFIHRDVKPDNILFQGQQAMLADFGIARLTDSQTHMTQHGSVLGTPTYMSPEQVNGAAIDTRSDLYSLGIVLYELLAGTPPFAADSAIATGIQHVTHEVPSLPPAFSCYQPFIERALAKDRDHRPPDTESFISELDNATAQSPWALDEDLQWLRSHRESTTRYSVRTKKKSVATAGRFIAVVAAGLGVTWLLYTGSQTSEDNAEPVTTTPPAAQESVTNTSSAEQPSTDIVDTTTNNQLIDNAKTNQPTAATDTTIEITTPAAQPDNSGQPLAEAEAQRMSGNWFTDEPGAVTLFKGILAVDPQHRAALEAMQQMTTQTRQAILQHINDKQWGQAADLLSQLQSNWPDYPDLATLTNDYEQAVQAERALQQRLAQQREARQAQMQRTQSMLDNAAAAEAAGQFWQPANNNALFYYRAALGQDTNNTTALNAIARLKKNLVQQVTVQIDAENLPQATALLAAFEASFPDDTLLPDLTGALDTQRATLQQRAQQQALEAEAQRQAAAIDSLHADVNSWMSQPADSAIAAYPPLAQRIATLLLQAPQNDRLLLLQSQTGTRYAKLSEAAQETEDDLFRMPGF
ncbi:MAG: protein kinase [Pseudomonadota bacterium]